MHVLATGEGLVTPEYAPKGMRLKGLFPIYYQEEIIGLANFEGGLDSIKRSMKPKNIDFLFFLDNKYLDIAASVKGNPVIGAFTLCQSDIDQEFFDYTASRLPWDKALQGYFFDDEYLTVALEIKRFDGDAMGMYLVGQKSGIVTQRIDESRRLLYTLYIAFLAMLALLLVALFIFTDRSIIRPI